MAKALTLKNMFKPYAEVFARATPEFAIDNFKHVVTATLHSNGKPKKWAENLRVNATAAGFVEDTEASKKLDRRELYATCYAHPSGVTITLTENFGMGYKYVNRYLTVTLPVAAPTE